MTKSKYNEQQLEVLRKRAIELFEVGFAQDKDLATSTCTCCSRKRALYKRLTKELKEVSA